MIRTHARRHAPHAIRHVVPRSFHRAVLSPAACARDPFGVCVPPPPPLVPAMDSNCGFPTLPYVRDTVVLVVAVAKAVTLLSGTPPIFPLRVETRRAWRWAAVSSRWLGLVP